VGLSVVNVDVWHLSPTRGILLERSEQRDRGVAEIYQHRCQLMAYRKSILLAATGYNKIQLRHAPRNDTQISVPSIGEIT